MKEMTIEQKAKAYDKAIEHARSLLKTIGNATLGNLVLKNEFKTMFPVLEESEDEMIRNALITYHSSTGSIHALDKFTSKEICAWLEKQGEKDLVTCPICGWEIKKQGEQKPSEWHREDEQNLNACLGYIPDEFLRRWLTDIIHVKYDKPADKVEPKIKAGDWVVCNNGPHHIFQVIERSWPNAKYRDLNGTEIFLNVNTLDKQYHLWTIQDAKDGDVLYDGNAACIFRKTMWDDDAIWIDTYCGINIDNEFKVNDEDECWCLSSDCSLATKEQRDLLFQKMKEAGYEWDTKKKELKKIVAPIFHIGDRVRYKGHACDGVITEITNTDYICGDAKLPISTQDKLELVEQKTAEEYNITGIGSKNAQGKLGKMIKNLKPINGVLEQGSAWSEEDEKNYDSLLKIICASNKSEELINKLYDWFKSLKDRVQPKQEWSEEDESRIDSLCLFLEAYGNQYYGCLTLQGTISWLKSLRPQINITDEELAQAKKDAYNDVLDKIEYDGENPTFDDGWHAAIWYFKKRNMQPHNTWKPSDEQMGALDDVISSRDIKYDVLSELWNNLNKLRDV